MIRDFAEGIKYDIHKYNKEAPRRHKEETWWYRERERAKERFDQRYIHMSFSISPSSRRRKRRCRTLGQTRW